MALTRHRFGRYADLAHLDEAWDRLACVRGGSVVEAGVSTEGRPIWRYDFGNPLGPTVLLTSLVHGVEVIGGLALLETVRALLSGGLAERARLVVLPVVNPDALAVNLARLDDDRVAAQRCNARGVDLNRNFAVLTTELLLHPFAGSRLRWSPHYVGPHAFSEPESCAVRDVALETHPALSIGFHSYGNLLLYPWAYTEAPNPRHGLYRALGEAFCRALPRDRYAVKQAASWYRTVGDMDDWLDATLGTLAFTVEVSRPQRSFLRPRRLLNPFWWMNPAAADDAIANVVPGVCALIRAAVERGVGAARRWRGAGARDATPAAADALPDAAE